MNYEFPVIETLDDLLPAIEGRPEFIVAEKEGYIVVNYNVAFEDTFPPVNVAGGSAKMRAERSRMNALRRECRGIIFDSETRKIIRRPYHKFFNVNEREETLDKKIDLSQDNIILEKLDGSMIAPFIVNSRMIWGTKMGATEVAMPVETFVMHNPEYIRAAAELIAMKLTPIFEWCSRKQRIVMDYPEDRLILTAIRDMKTGEYYPYEALVDEANYFSLPVVKAFNPQKDMKEFVNYVHDLSDLEGFVVRFENSGHMVKLKCHWYVQIHKAKEAILQDRNVVDAILNNNIGDIKAHMPQEDRDRLTAFESALHDKISYQVGRIGGILDFIWDKQIDRKEFALNHAPSMDPFTRQLIFKLWGGNSGHDALIYQEIINVIKNHLTNNTKYNTLKNDWFEGVQYNA